MFGLGDEAPAPDTVALMEDILVEYLHELVWSSLLGWDFLLIIHSNRLLLQDKAQARPSKPTTCEERSKAQEMSVNSRGWRS